MENATIVLKIPKAAYAEVMVHHVKEFESKVDFIAKLPPFKPLSIREIRRLTPCFHLLVRIETGATVMYSAYLSSGSSCSYGLASILRP